MKIQARAWSSSAIVAILIVVLTIIATMLYLFLMYYDATYAPLSLLQSKVSR